MNKRRLTSLPPLPADTDIVSKRTLAALAGISLRRFEEHLAGKVGNLHKAKFKEPGLGVYFKLSLCRKWLNAMRARHQPNNTPAV